MKTLKEILNESAHSSDSSIEKQKDNIDAKADEASSKDLKAISAGMFTKRSLLRSMKHAEGVIQLTNGKKYTIYNPKAEDQDTEGMFQDDMLFAIDADGNEVKVEYSEITSYNEKYHEDDAAAPRRMTYDDAHQPKTKMEYMAAVKRELRAMKVADIKASYQYIKAAHCNTREAMHGMGTKKDMLTAMMKDLKGMKASALRASYEYIKSSHCGPREGAHEDEMVNAGAHEDEMVNAGAHRDDLKHPKPQPVMASHCTEETEISEGLGINFSKVSDDGLLAWTAWAKGQVKLNPEFKQDLQAAEREIKKRKLMESTELDEMKTKDDDLAVMIYDYIGADTEGLPLKTLIMQAVGKYFGSQKVDGPVGG